MPRGDDTVTTFAPVQVFKSLADDTRLMLMLLIRRQGELCVCELTGVLQLSQPKISRHLAQLRRVGLLVGRREGQWIHYAIASELPEWITATLAAADEGEAQRLDTLAARLEALGEGPERRQACC
ncbi:metalloregulator ArsR/SmtB family transcription factor [Halomonas halophila]|nr:MULTISPECIES: metalloregulator ArsR/SmtB family transcription factor [Halomonas]MDR5888058.1 metalloregulator ArsR/SmtB family transcription factor [Halomonas salina]RAH37461.1 transcriptional regulator [Halomonas sp. SL1]WJY08582.1 metalloregulator ArsR/SmtB family transcription factor [Halomonas halophila]